MLLKISNVLCLVLAGLLVLMAFCTVGYMDSTDADMNIESMFVGDDLNPDFVIAEDSFGDFEKAYFLNRPILMLNMDMP